MYDTGARITGHGPEFSDCHPTLKNVNHIKTTYSSVTVTKPTREYLSVVTTYSSVTVTKLMRVYLFIINIFSFVTGT